MITAYTDGACSGNNKLNKEKTKAGYGVYFETPIVVKGKKIIKVSGPVDRSIVPASNQRGEIMGVLRCLDLFRNYLEEQEKEAPPGLTLYSDSRYCLGTCTEWIYNWKANPKKYAKKYNMDLWNKVWDHIQYFRKIYGDGYEEKMQFIWVRGHNGTHGNEMADQLATQGIHLEKEKRIVLKPKKEKPAEV